MYLCSVKKIEQLKTMQVIDLTFMSRMSGKKWSWQIAVMETPNDAIRMANMIIATINGNFRNFNIPRFIPNDYDYNAVCNEVVFLGRHFTREDSLNAKVTITQDEKPNLPFGSEWLADDVVSLVQYAIDENRRTIDLR